MPRQSKLNDYLQGVIVSALEAGAYAVEAFQAAGVGETTYYRWMDRGCAEQDRQDAANALLDSCQDELDAIGTKPGSTPKRRRRTVLLKQRKALTADAKPHPDHEPYRAFREACARASARAEVEATELLRQVGAGWREQCSVCEGEGTVTVREAARSDVGETQSSRTKATVRVCGTCEGRGEIVRDPDWRAIAWYLERRHPDRWRKRESHELEHHGSETGAPIQIVAGVGPPEHTKAAHDFLRALRDGTAVDASDRGAGPPASAP